MTALRVGVIGGSLGGLTAALVLRDAGCEVEVFERSPTGLRGHGAGLGMHEATMRWSRERLGMDWDALSVKARSERFLDREGNVVFEGPTPQRVTSWTTLHRHLFAELGTGPYRAGWELTGLEQEGDVVVGEFANGERRDFDLLVASDGIGSTVRRLLLGDVPFAFSGYVCWRGIVDAETLGPELFEELRHGMTYHFGERFHILSYPIPDEDGPVPLRASGVTFVWYRNVAGEEELDRLLTDRTGERRRLSVPAGYVALDVREELRAAAERDLPPAFAELVRRAEEPLLAVIGDLEVPRMVEGRVVLIGDAAFVARPHTAAGTAKVAHNAWTLGEAVAAALARGDELDLSAWEAEQMELGRSLVARSRAWGEKAQVHSSFVPGDPENRTGLFGPGR